MGKEQEQTVLIVGSGGREDALAWKLRQSPRVGKASLALFDFGSKLCKRRGLILVDTKYEFGLYNGKLTLIDEIHTPTLLASGLPKVIPDVLNKVWSRKTLKKSFCDCGMLSAVMVVMANRRLCRNN